MKAGLWAVFILFMAAGFFVRASLPDLALSDRDTWGYLSPALSWMNERGFHQEVGRDWFYPLLISGALKLGAIAKIAAAQKTLGWLTGALLAAAWVCWVSLLPVHRLGRFFALLLGALPLAVQMLNPQTLYFELQLRPESVMPFFVYGQLLCLAAFCRYRWYQPKPLTSAVFGALAILLAYACMLLKPSWLLATIPTCLPVFVGLVLGSQIKLPFRLAPLAAGLLAVAALALVPSRIPFIIDYESTTVLPKTLFSVHAKLIKDHLQDQFDRMPDSDPDKPRLQKLVGVLQQEFTVAEKPPHNYEFLGYDPDYLRYRSQMVPALFEYCHGSRQEFNAFCKKAYVDTALSNPLGMAHKVLVQYLHFLFPKPSTFVRSEMDIHRGCEYSLESLPESLPPDYDPRAAALLAQYRSDLEAGKSSTHKLAANPHVLQLIKYPAMAALPLEIALVLALLWVHLRPAWHDLRLPGWVALLFLSAPAGNAATVALVHALDIGRYRAGYGGFHFFALAAIAVFLGVVLQRIFLQIVLPKFRKPTPWKT